MFPLNVPEPDEQPEEVEILDRCVTVKLISCDVEEAVEVDSDLQSKPWEQDESESSFRCTTL